MQKSPFVTITDIHCITKICPVYPHHRQYLKLYDEGISLTIFKTVFSFDFKLRFFFMSYKVMRFSWFIRKSGTNGIRDAIFKSKLHSMWINVTNAKFERILLLCHDYEWIIFIHLNYLFTTTVWFGFLSFWDTRYIQNQTVHGVFSLITSHSCMKM